MDPEFCLLPWRDETEERGRGWVGVAWDGMGWHLRGWPSRFQIFPITSLCEVKKRKRNQNGNYLLRMSRPAEECNTTPAPLWLAR